MRESRKFIFIVLALIFLIIGGTLGYLFLLGVSFIDALYMTIITISTVGYQEVAEMTDASKLFSIFLILWGLGIAGYAFTSIVAMFFEGEFRKAWRKRKMESKIAQLKDHYILCGAGETGHTVIERFMESKEVFVVVEKDEEKVKELEREGVLAILGDATHEEVLSQARIENAKGLITSLSNDADNVFTVLTAREMNKDIYIVSRAIEKSAGIKLKKAGANNSISPNEIGGRRMAAIVLRPSIVSFLDVITKAGDIELDLEDVVVGKGSILAGKTLREAKVPERTGLMIIAIRRKDERKFLFNPSSEKTLDLGDVMMVLGREEQVDKLKKLACDFS
ncbi:voltage-gated potassium channel [Natranaerovirga pectinivora]|uniref:Voltage-gated potassium channel n=1 Tax=Natranaerovirga pectinivora TaxID=682400 RepID=A0A4R3MJ47_9FIRM|nr:potassium channel protein [Natranaerovirga pectinivora]TCT14043.1 voltage-gated potassium channel [Natranaerovirga pectinivora]